MTAAMFDTHKFVRRLKESGFSEAQAEALTEAFHEASGEFDIATKQDINHLRLELKGDIQLLRWMLGFNLGFTLLILAKLFVLP